MEYLERRRALVESRLSAVLDAAEPEVMTERLEHVSLVPAASASGRW